MHLQTNLWSCTPYSLQDGPARIYWLSKWSVTHIVCSDSWIPSTPATHLGECRWVEGYVCPGLMSFTLSFTSLTQCECKSWLWLYGMLLMSGVLSPSSRLVNCRFDRSLLLLPTSPVHPAEPHLLFAIFHPCPLAPHIITSSFPPALSGPNFNLA